jgi:hypothetical protein
MMQRRHLENPFAAQLETAYLQDHRHCLDHIHAADEQQQDFLLQ